MPVHEYSFPQILYHPQNPLDLRVVLYDGDIYKLFIKGFKTVRLDRIGRLVRKARKLSKASMYEFKIYLEKHGLFFGEATLYKIEQGKSNFETLNLATLRQLAAALHMPFVDLIRPMERAKAREKPPKLKVQTDPTPPLYVFEVLLSEGPEFHHSTWIASDPDAARKMCREQFPEKNIEEVVCHSDPGLVSLHKESN